MRSGDWSKRSSCRDASTLNVVSGVRYSSRPPSNVVASEFSVRLSGTPSNTEASSNVTLARRPSTRKPVSALARTVAPAERDWFMKLLIGAFAIRVAAATMFALFPETRVFHEDAEGYENSGMMIAAGWVGRGVPVPSGAFQLYNYGYIWVSAFANAFFGIARVSPSYLNVLIGTALLVFSYRLARKFFHVRVARMGALLLAFYPSMILWSSLAVKDPVVTLCILVALSAERAPASSATT